MKTDRIFGVVVILVALAFIVSAYNLPAGNIFDKLGPKAFPIIVGIGMILSAAMLVIKPDPERTGRSFRRCSPSGSPRSFWWATPTR